MAAKKPATIVFKTLLDGSDCDSRWTFHVDPAQMDWPQLTTEVCDGRPSDVDGDKKHWVNDVKRLCPWSSRPYQWTTAVARTTLDRCRRPRSSDRLRSQRLGKPVRTRQRVECQHRTLGPRSPRDEGVALPPGVYAPVDGPTTSHAAKVVEETPLHDEAALLVRVRPASARPRARTESSA